VERRAGARKELESPQAQILRIGDVFDSDRPEEDHAISRPRERNVELALRVRADGGGG
jgi:hypothetical protein